MGKCVRRYRDEELGIQVTVIQYEKKYDLEILIPKDVFNRTKSVSIKTKQFSLQANALNLPLIMPCVIKASRYYQKGKYGLFKNVKATINFTTDDCFGVIILSPKFYVPFTKRATPENVKKANNREQSYINKNQKLAESKKVMSFKKGINDTPNKGRASRR